MDKIDIYLWNLEIRYAMGHDIVTDNDIKTLTIGSIINGKRFFVPLSAFKARRCRKQLINTNFFSGDVKKLAEKWNNIIAEYDPLKVLNSNHKIFTRHH